MLQTQTPVMLPGPGSLILQPRLNVDSSATTVVVINLLASMGVG